MKLSNAAGLIASSLGMAIAMSLSSLFLWKSNWLVVPDGSFYDSHGISLSIGVVASALVFVGCCACRKGLHVLIERVVPALTLAALVLSGAPLPADARWLLGFALPVVGAYALAFAWFYVISIKDVEDSLITLLLAWVISFFVRIVFEFFDGPLSSWLASIGLFAASWLLLLWSLRSADRFSPMVTSTFSRNRVSYRYALKNFWRSALYLGAFGFLSGVVRFVAIDSAAMTVINYCSALAGLIGPLVLMALWQRRTIRYNIDGVFRFAYPLMVVTLVLLPFFTGAPFVVLAAALYMVYSFVSLSVEALSIQVSHDYGIDPTFCFGFQVFVAVAAQGFGYLLGVAAPAGAAFGLSSSAVIALGSLGFLALVLYGTRALHPSRSEESRPIEFLSLAQMPAAADGGISDGSFDLEGGLADDAEAGGEGEGALVDEPRYEDKTALRCDLIGRKYALSQREIEVMALVARGYTISSIASKLFISDNTVKTHLRRLYQKLDIHKKQELFALINSYVD